MNTDNFEELKINFEICKLAMEQIEKRIHLIELANAPVKTVRVFNQPGDKPNA
jgi:hypothetical protein